jgi:predicted PolB exonuclease-like 3'-5' exonuclease
VLNYRGLIHGVRATRFWDQGEDDRDFKWNNYISRYHARHLDLMDLMAMYQPRAGAPLDDVAQLMGFPGKIGIGGAHVWQAWQDGGIEQIRNYCEADVANTYLVYLRFQLMRGVLTTEQYKQETALLRAMLEKSPQAHWREFLQRWPV